MIYCFSWIKTIEPYKFIRTRVNKRNRTTLTRVERFLSPGGSSVNWSSAVRRLVLMLLLIMNEQTIVWCHFLKFSDVFLISLLHCKWFSYRYYIGDHGIIFTQVKESPFHWKHNFKKLRSLCNYISYLHIQKFSNEVFSERFLWDQTGN